MHSMQDRRLTAPRVRKKAVRQAGADHHDTVMHFSIKQLQHLVLLADECHFARAADRAALSQSAFSRSIQQLESALGVRLFDRNAKHVQPTVVGNRAVERARALLASAGDLSRELSLLQAGELGDIKLGAGALAGATALPGPLVRLRRAHPEVRVDVEVIESNALLDKLLRAGLDFFVGEYGEVPRHDDLRFESLGFMHLNFFCRSGHPLLAQDTVTVGDLSRYRLASVHIPAHIMRTLTPRMANGESKMPELSLQSGNPNILRDYVLGTDAVLLATERPFQLEVMQGLLVPLAVSGYPLDEHGAVMSAEMGLIGLTGRTPTPAGETLMDLIREEARTLFTRSYP
jgi:DNA-binding transcriptional LysR family regulator